MQISLNEHLGAAGVSSDKIIPFHAGQIEYIYIFKAVAGQSSREFSQCVKMCWSQNDHFTSWEKSQLLVMSYSVIFQGTE